MTLRPSDPEERRRQARRWRERQREAARRYEQKVKEEVLEGEREWNSIPPVNRERKGREWERAYGSEERVKWIKTLPCLVCGRTPSDNAHVPSKSGVGRKGDADMVVPLCPDTLDGAGHHTELDNGDGLEAFEERHKLDLHAEAARIEAAWQRRQGNG